MRIILNGKYDGRFCMDLTNGIDAIKEFLSWLSYSHYHVKKWGTESILTVKASTIVFITPAPTQPLAANMGRVCNGLRPVYLLSRRL